MAQESPGSIPAISNCFFSLLGSKVIERKSELLGSKIVRRECTQMEIKLTLAVLPGLIKVIIQNYGLGEKLSIAGDGSKFWMCQRNSQPTFFCCQCRRLKILPQKNQPLPLSHSSFDDVTVSLHLWGFARLDPLERSPSSNTFCQSLHLNNCTTDCICVETSEWRTPQLSQSNIKHFQQQSKHLLKAKASCW